MLIVEYFSVRLFCAPSAAAPGKNCPIFPHAGEEQRMREKGKEEYRKKRGRTGKEKEGKGKKEVKERVIQKREL